MCRNSRFFKIIVTVMVAVTVFACLPISSSASSVNLTTQITHTKDFIVQNAVPVRNWNETVMYSAVGFFTLTDIEPFIPEADTSSAYTTATRILTLISVGELNRESSAENSEVKALSDMQKDDGSFGDLNSTLYSVMALKACNELFMSEKAVEYILSLQSEDGGFYVEGEHPVVTTSRVMTVLSEFGRDPKVSEALNKTIDFVRGQRVEDGFFDDGRCDTVCAAMIGLIDLGVTVTGDEWGEMVFNLVKFRNSDYSYNMMIEDEQFDISATLHAIAAFDAVGNGKSVYVRLMEDGALNQYSLKDYLHIFKGYGILVLVSAVFWVYFMFFKNRKKNKKAVGVND